MNFREFKKAAQQPETAYLLITEQDYLKDRVMEFCREQIEEPSRAFDWSVFNLEKEKAKDPKTQIQDLVDQARTLPWMNPFRWIYVKNAQEGGEALGAYLADPAPRTVLVLEATRKVRSWPKLTSIEWEGKLDAARWVSQKVKYEGYSIDREAANTLVEQVGGDLGRLESELEKQLLWNMDSKTISVDSVLNLAVEARERDIFELISAMAGSRSAAALRIVNRLFETGTSHHQILAMLYWNFRRLLVASEMLEQGRPFGGIVRQLKIWSYKNREEEVRSYPRFFLTSVLLRLREADRLFKSSRADSKMYLERVIIDTCGKASV